LFLLFYQLEDYLLLCCALAKKKKMLSRNNGSFFYIAPIECHRMWIFLPCPFSRQAGPAGRGGFSLQ